MNDSKRDEIIDDLLRKRPYGPKGKKNSDLEFTETEEYCYDRHGYRKFLECLTPNYGYDTETLFNLGFRSAGDVKNYVHQRWFAGMSSWEIGQRKATVTRRSNRIWSRISGAIHHVKQNGGRGNDPGYHVFSVDQRTVPGAVC